MKVLFTSPARSQFLSALAYIRQDDAVAALRFRRRAETALRRLQRFPKAGRRLPEFPELPYREVIVSPYRFFYRLAKDTVWIVAVWHGARLPAKPGNPGQEP